MKIMRTHENKGIPWAGDIVGFGDQGTLCKQKDEVGMADFLHNS